MKKFTADRIVINGNEMVQNQVIITDDNGKILAIEPLEQHDLAGVAAHKGIIVAGFVNAHCHLELSHMKGLVATGTTLIPFITGVVTQRNASPEVIQTAIEKAEAEMLAGGIVAVGDISNVTDTFAQKAKGNLKYHTFIEMFDFLQEHDTTRAFEQYKAVYDALQVAENGSKKTAVPHAPYSVSASLFKAINGLNPQSGATVSIHNQETQPENDLFERGEGAFYDFYGKFGISLDAFVSSQKPSIHYALQHMNPQNKALFVHNTLTTPSDLAAAHAWGKAGVFWATCPNANLYIENRLPFYQHFLDQNAKVCIGTDSLTSNWQLSVLSELQTIHRYQSYVPFLDLVQWATLNGAEALGMDSEIGSITIGKTPALNLLEGIDIEKPHFTKSVKVKRLI